MGRMDYNNVPYIFHPFHLAEQMEDEICCTVALLHDVVEDTAVSLKDLERDFPIEVVEAVRLLTHGKDVDYFAYVKQIKTNPVATRVKLEDLKHNLDAIRNVDGAIPQDKVQSWKLNIQKPWKSFRLNRTAFVQVMDFVHMKIVQNN